MPLASNAKVSRYAKANNTMFIIFADFNILSFTAAGEKFLKFETCFRIFKERHGIVERHGIEGILLSTHCLFI